MKRWLIGIVLLAIWVVSAGHTFAQTDSPTTRLRLIHAASDGAAVDIYMNGALVATGLGYGQATPHFRLPAGVIQVDVRAAGETDSAPIFSNSFELDQELAFSLILYGSGSLQSILTEDILDAMAPGAARLTALHVLQGADSLDILRADGAAMMTPVLFAQPYGTINIPSGSYNLVAAPTGAPDAQVADFGQLDLQSNLLYNLIITGDAQAADAFVLSTPVNSTDADGLVRLAHGVADNVAVDVYLDGILAFPNLAFGVVTPHIALPVGDHELALRQAGLPPNSEAIFTETVSVAAGAQTIAVVSQDDELSLLALTDAVDGIGAEQTRLQVLNFSGEAFTLNINGDEVAVEALSASDALDLAPGELEITDGAELSGLTYGGTLYSVVTLGDQTILTSTALDVETVSAPFEQTVAVVETTTDAAAPVTDAAAPAAEASPTLPPTQASASSELVVAQPTEALPSVATAEPVTVAQAAPTEVLPPVAAAATATPVPTLAPTQAPVVAQPNAVPTRPGIYPPVDVIFGVVTLNQGTNLQCREYPSSNARSLGLVPNNSELVIDGLFAPRDTTGDQGGRGDAILIENIPDLTQLALEDFEISDFPIDFVAALDVNAFWLNVTWVLEDGTPFGCWVNAQYVQISYNNKRVQDPNAYLEMVKNRNIDLVPYNIPGGPRDPDAVVNPQQLSAPTPRANSSIMATVNVNRGVNLQLRRTPGVTGESLSLVPGGAQLQVINQTSIPPTGNVGEPEVPEWLYVEYLQPDNVAVRGWISAQYIILTLAGRLINISEVPVAETVETGGFVNSEGEVQADSTGITGGAAPVIPGSNSGVAAPVATTSQIQGVLLIDPGANLNLRDRPASDGIVRASIPSGAVLAVTGRNGAGDWLDVILTTPTGDVPGWVASEFVQLSFQNAPYELQDLPITTGEVDTFNPNATPTAVATP